MIPWTLLDSSTIPGSTIELALYQRGAELSIRIVGAGELMNSRLHSSEAALAELSCQELRGHRGPRLLIGGLGMGFTLAAALRNVDEEAQVEVAELVPAVVRWNHGIIGEQNGRPLEDQRVTLHETDVTVAIKSAKSKFDAILLDIDNGPDGLTHQSNDWLYSRSGLKAASTALRPGGVLAVWSAEPDQGFERRLRQTGFAVKQERVRAHGSKGARHVIWLARR